MDSTDQEGDLTQQPRKPTPNQGYQSINFQLRASIEAVRERFLRFARDLCSFFEVQNWFSCLLLSIKCYFRFFRSSESTFTAFEAFWKVK